MLVPRSRMSKHRPRNKARSMPELAAASGGGRGSGGGAAAAAAPAAEHGTNCEPVFEAATKAARRYRTLLAKLQSEEFDGRAPRVAAREALEGVHRDADAFLRVVHRQLSVLEQARPLEKCRTPTI